MPESPEVQVLVDELGRRLTGRALAGVDVIEFRTTKTRARPPEGLVGERVTGVTRHGKLIDLSVGETPPRRLARTARLGALGRSAEGDTDSPPARPRHPRSSSLDFDDGSTLELTDAGEWVSLGCWVVDDPTDVPAVAKLGPDPANPGFSRADFDDAVVGAHASRSRRSCRSRSRSRASAMRTPTRSCTRRRSRRSGTPRPDVRRARPPLRGDGRRHRARRSMRAVACRSTGSRRRRSRPCACTAGREMRAPCAATRSAISRSRARRPSTARPARPGVRCFPCESRDRAAAPQIVWIPRGRRAAAPYTAKGERRRGRCRRPSFARGRGPSMRRTLRMGVVAIAAAAIIGFGTTISAVGVELEPGQSTPPAVTEQPPRRPPSRVPDRPIPRSRVRSPRSRVPTRRYPPFRRSRPLRHPRRRPEPIPSPNRRRNPRRRNRLPIRSSPKRPPRPSRPHWPRSPRSRQARTAWPEPTDSTPRSRSRSGSLSPVPVLYIATGRTFPTR